MSIKIIKLESDVEVTEGELFRYEEEYRKAFAMYAGPRPSLEEFIRDRQGQKRPKDKQWVGSFTIAGSTWTGRMREVYERDFPPGVELGPRRYGPYETKEEALEAAEKKGLSTTSLRDVNKLIWLWTNRQT
jgi:hypothetical protein